MTHELLGQLLGQDWLNLVQICVRRFAFEEAEASRPKGKGKGKAKGRKERRNAGLRRFQ